MPHHHVRQRAAGTVDHVFAHRFTLRSPSGVMLVDLTPEGRDLIKLKPGDEITVEGEMKPSELKADRVTHSGRTVEIARKPKHEGPHPGPRADAEQALKAVRDVGYEPLAEARRKPKHFEILARRDRELSELHVELDGRIRKVKPGASDDPKWTLFA
ncbi:MAG: hypothetical protein BGP06_15130 [Rhizobiales bacterium 65-9]|nr:hypothetical protein [Hyphomicrobiales bacterium]OJY38972.1 MAG: hypothetical protein BGP06_15130 [Rhizobiales bacterium 65-9]